MALAHWVNTFLENVMEPKNFMHTYLHSPVPHGGTVHIDGVGRFIVQETGKTVNTPYGLIGKKNLLRWEDVHGAKYAFPCHFVKCCPVGRDDLGAICVVTRICAPRGGNWFEQSDDSVWLPTSSIRAAVPYLKGDCTGRIFPLVL